MQVNCNVFTCVHYSDGLCEADSICVDSENQETKDKNQTLCVKLLYNSVKEIVA
ncbi:MAG: DUF1540 domain-containing protein [Acutalibacteraceae bacterium]